MAQTKAYTDEQVIAAGKALRARGIEPTRTTLFNQLGNKGQPVTAFKTWEKYRDGAPSKADLDAILSGEDATPEMTSKAEAVSTAMAALIAQIRAEVAAPLLRINSKLQDTIANLQAHVEDLEELVEAMHNGSVHGSNTNKPTAKPASSAQGKLL